MLVRDVTLGGLPVYVTDHAIFQRLQERLKPLDEFDDLPGKGDTEAWFSKMTELIRKLEPTELDPVHRVKRLFSNAYVPAEYYINRDYNLRFVVYHDEVNERRVVLTVEEPYGSVEAPPTKKFRFDLSRLRRGRRHRRA